MSNVIQINDYRELKRFVSIPRGLNTSQLLLTIKNLHWKKLSDTQQNICNVIENNLMRGAETPVHMQYLDELLVKLES